MFINSIATKFDQTVADFNDKMSRMPDWFQRIFGGDNMWDMITTNGLQAIGIGILGWLITSYFERRHIRQIAKRETIFAHINLSTTKTFPSTNSEGVFVVGSVVVFHDLFRTLLIKIRQIVGGRIALYERLAMRGRREAINRMKEEAHIRDLSMIANVRLETVQINGRFLAGIALTATGTGIRPVD